MCVKSFYFIADRSVCEHLRFIYINANKMHLQCEKYLLKLFEKSIEVANLQ